MALIRCSSGGTSNLCKIGTFSVTSDSQTITIDDVGFKPKYIAVLFQGANGTPTSAVTGALRCIYDERVSTSYCHRGMYGSSQTVNSVALTSNVSRISEVNDDGFKFYNGGAGSNFKGTYYYFAIG